MVGLILRVLLFGFFCPPTVREERKDEGEEEEEKNEEEGEKEKEEKKKKEEAPRQEYQPFHQLHAYIKSMSFRPTG